VWSAAVTCLSYVDHQSLVLTDIDPKKNYLSKFLVTEVVKTGLTLLLPRKTMNFMLQFPFFMYRDHWYCCSVQKIDHLQVTN
jgi:hypothetical protein